ncbi:AsmA family protein [Maribellus comscasis]|uniref:AsmA family protein n=1 Tax=Maribellus comscasis TaxID=2681766 RepID=A0A6I6JW45_9BACT|nr:AsmA family protein [Maribellus comscasis]QGY46831.1 AsmA family protein [Maribellus comscasis]
MKKTIIIILVVFFVVIGALAAIPLFFKNTLLEKTENTINKQVNAEISFDGFKLSLFRNFPKVTLQLENVLVIGVDEFQQDTLLNMAALRATMNLKELFNKEGMSIEEVYLLHPGLNMVVAESGKTNWDLAKKSSEPSELSKEEGGEEGGFNLQLEKIEIEDATIFYTDKQAKMLLGFEDINFHINGEMYGTSAKLNIAGKVDRFTTEYEGTKYISNTSLETKTLLDIDYEKMNIAVQENELLINRLPLEITGSVQIPSDSMFFDLVLSTKESGFENFLALVPPDYSDYLKDFETSGTATVSGKVSGLFFGENYPAFSLAINVSNGNFHYTELPDEIKNIKADISVSKPQGVLDLTEVKIKEAHAEIKNNPIDLSLTLNKLISDPYFDGAFVGKINFDHVKDAIPLDSVNISGTIDANLFVKGNYSSVEKEQYDKIQSDGVVLLDNFVYETADLTQPVYIPGGSLNFSPKSINLSQFNVKVGQSDFNLRGNVTNYLNYVFKDGTLAGDLQLNSGFVNLNEMLSLQVQKGDSQNVAKTTEENESEKLVFDIPENIDFIFRSNIQRASLDRIAISDIKGLITAKEGKLMLNGLNMNMLNGQLSMTGSYENTAQNQPLFDFGFDIIEFDIPQAFQSLSGMQNIVPVAGQSTGKLSTNLKLNGQLSEQFKLIPASVDGNGIFSTKNLQINNSKVFDQLKGILKAEKLQNVAVDDFKANFTVQDGNLLLRPFETKIAGQETNISGSLNAQNLLNMRLDFNIQRDAFGADIQSILSAIPGNKNITVVPAGVIIEGPVGKPDVKMDLSATRKTITDATKDDLQKSLNKLGEGLKKLFK